MTSYDIVFYSMNVFVFVIMVYLVFMIAKYENYNKGYKDGWQNKRNTYKSR